MFKAWLRGRLRLFLDRGPARLAQGIGLGDRRFVELCYQTFLDRPADPQGLATYAEALGRGMPRLEVIRELIGSPEYRNRLATHLRARAAADPEGAQRGFDAEDLVDSGGLDDRRFVELCVRHFLERPPDPQGVQAHLDRLAVHGSRAEVLKAVAQSDEHRELLQRRLLEAQGGVLPDLTTLRPSHYHQVPHRDGAGSSLVFRVESPADHDWLERRVQEDGYYEGLGVWGLGINQDKRVLAELAAGFGPRRVLELGCFTGWVLRLLADQGIQATGVEISHLALALAAPGARRLIRFGDLLDLDLEPGFDLIMGLDVFEHLNPNRLGDYLARCRALLAPGGVVVANIPALGPDPVFGEPHPLKLATWPEQAAQNGGLLADLEVDARGWPVHGHLIWATSAWWEASFAAHGLRRDPGAERELHERYDAFWRESAPARLSTFVFRAV